MQHFQNLETKVLLTMLTAHAAYYAGELSKEEFADCKTTIDLLHSELASRLLAKESIIFPATFSGMPEVLIINEALVVPI